MIEDFEKFYNRFCDKTGHKITNLSEDSDILRFIELMKAECQIVDEEYVSNILFGLRDLLLDGYNGTDAWDYIAGEDYIWRE